MNFMTEPAQLSKILVVDDSPESLLQVSDLLMEDYRVKVANEGAKALRIAQSEDPPDLILLDINMPGMDGYEVCRRLKEDERTRRIPVIFFTAKSEIDDEKRGLELGAVDYIAKPISPSILLARVRTHLDLAHRTRMLLALSEKLSRYVPPQVYRSIIEGKQDVVVHARRKKLTIFFSDIEDFTSTTENMQPEDLTELLNEYFSEMSVIALRFGATIDKFIGDAIMIFFGDPGSLGVKEDALQCVRMAVAMQRRMAELKEIWRGRGIERPFRMRIGINTGYCNVGNFGSPQRMDYTIIGAEVNLASRMEQVGEPDGVMLSYETYALVKEEFEAEERPPFHAKGIAREIRSFALTGILAPEIDERHIVVAKQDGMRLTLNMLQLTGELREKAIAQLMDAAEKLKKD